MHQCKSGALKWVVLCGLTAVAVGWVIPVPQNVLLAADATTFYEGVTRPSEERLLVFAFPGIVREVRVKVGDKIAAGQSLIRLENRIEQSQVASLQLEAKSPLKIEYAERGMKQKQVQLERKKQLREESAASPFEVEEAELEAALAETQFGLSKEENALKKLEMERAQIKLELSELKSPIDGFVQRLAVKEGEYADPQQNQRAAAVVVKNDPLKVEVFLPSAQAAPLAYGQELEVAYPGEEKWLTAKITFLDPVIDARSGMRELHLELANPQQRESGWHVNVRVPQK